MLAYGKPGVFSHFCEAVVASPKDKSGQIVGVSGDEIPPRAVEEKRVLEERTPPTDPSEYDDYTF